MLLNSYYFFKFFLFLLVCFLIGWILLLLSFFFCKEDFQSFDNLSIYECGFEPLDDSFQIVDFYFLRIFIVFLFFEVELLLTYPFFSVSGGLGSDSFITFNCVLIVFCFGFVYEWLAGVFNFNQNNVPFRGY